MDLNHGAGSVVSLSDRKEMAGSWYKAKADTLSRKLERRIISWLLLSYASDQAIRVACKGGLFHGFLQRMVSPGI